MKKTLYFDEVCGYTVSAVTENGLLSEFGFEKKNSQSIKGNIYKGRIVNVLQGMQAAFDDCGLERTCYLSADDALPDGEDADTDFPDLREGDEVMVQVVKPPVGKKGAKVTLFPSFVGKNVIYLPKTPFIGVSRKITDEELRNNLAYCAKSLIGENEGVVLRAASPYVKRDMIVTELNSLKEIYNSVVLSYNNAGIGSLLYSEVGLLRRVLRDILSLDIEEIHVGNGRLEKLIENFYTLFPPAKRRPVILHGSEKDMFFQLGLSEKIIALTDRRVELGNGAFLVIDKCEAMTVIDVNTGRYTGDDSLEQTVYHTNLLAAGEIARQVKLRDIGGIIVVDFIDMSSASHNRTVVEELEKALKKDGSHCNVGQMSEFGLVEFTRKRENSSVIQLMSKPCRQCKKGYGASPKLTLFVMRAKLSELYCDGIKQILIDLSADCFNELFSFEELINDLKSKFPDAEIYALAHRSYSDEALHFRYGNEFTVPDKAVKIN